jgi:hypothetical protein
MYHQVQRSQILASSHTVYLCVLYGTESKRRLFLYTAFTDWFLQPRPRVFTARYGLDDYVWFMLMIHCAVSQLFKHCSCAKTALDCVVYYRLTTIQAGWYFIMRYMLFLLAAVSSKFQNTEYLSLSREMSTVNRFISVKCHCHKAAGTTNVTQTPAWLTQLLYKVGTKLCPDLCKAGDRIMILMLRSFQFSALSRENQRPNFAVYNGCTRYIWGIQYTSAVTGNSATPLLESSLLNIDISLTTHSYFTTIYPEPTVKTYNHLIN